MGRPMLSPEYYLRQAELCRELARAGGGATPIARRLIALAEAYAAKAAEGPPPPHKQVRRPADDAKHERAA
jgi:hypothetical protein